jgi:Ca-activated chloride channel family protein
MVLAAPEVIYFIVPPLVLVAWVRWRRAKSHYTHPLVFYLRGRIKPASRLVGLPKWLELVALVALGLALLKPVVPWAEHVVASRGLDIVLVLDLSSSMQEPIDLEGALRRRRLGISQKEKTRLDAVKDVMLDFVQKRQGDRVGLVVFSENGYVVSPMTRDLAYLHRYLGAVDQKTLASEGQTAIGEGIFTAVQLAEQQAPGKRKGKVMVVLTDGENNTGRDVYSAIQKAQEAGFKLYLVGVEVRKSTEVLRLISAVEAAGGSYYDVKDAAQLAEAYADIARLEKGTYFTSQRLSQVPRFYPFALSALVLLAASAALGSLPFFTEIS